MTGMNTVIFVGNIPEVFMANKLFTVWFVINKCVILKPGHDSTIFYEKDNEKGPIGYPAGMNGPLVYLQISSLSIVNHVIIGQPFHFPV